MSRLTDQLATVLQGRTTLERPEVMDLARAAADGGRASGMQLKQIQDEHLPGQDPAKTASFELRGGGVLRGGLDIGPMGRVDVWCRDEGDGTRVVEAMMDGQEAQWSQERVFLIPISPKSVIGFQVYRKWLEALVDGIQRADNLADVKVMRLPEEP